MNPENIECEEVFIPEDDFLEAQYEDRFADGIEYANELLD